MNKQIIAAVFVFLFLTGGFAAALEKAGVTIPDTVTVDGHTLVLNGAGVRTKFIIKVYVGALYVTEPTENAAAVIRADEPAAIRMHFIYRKVDEKKLINAWNEGFDRATDGETAPIQRKIEAFNALFTTPAKKDDIYDIVYIPGKGTRVTRNGKLLGVVPGHDFKKALFGIWLSEKTAVPGVRKGMRGK